MNELENGLRSSGGLCVDLVVIPGFAGVSLLHKLLQLPFSYKLLYLLLQVSAVLYVMPVIFVEMVVFSFVTRVGGQV